MATNSAEYSDKWAKLGAPPADAVGELGGPACERVGSAPRVRAGVGALGAPRESWCRRARGPACERVGASRSEPRVRAGVGQLGAPRASGWARRARSPACERVGASRSEPRVRPVSARLTVEGLYYLLRYVRKFHEQKPKVPFFSVPVTCVRPLLLNPRRCDCSLPHRESALSSLARLLLGAGRSLDVCLFSISSFNLGSVVLAVYSRGVRVRVVTDSDYMALAGSQLGIFWKAGIEVRHDQDTNYMQHKFALIDGSILVTGSLNWSAQAIFRSKENVIIIKDIDIVKAFIEEFE
ncbi:mitochondrial cardiolipin hydrolase-like [Mobula birostris]|uniref:mitochondrial cardiolipin hydrolase-like n=1 Tax=Mobula birostris TaxID=1983395 RepID=UPI003B2802B4